jgi:hypothetical protein
MYWKEIILYFTLPALVFVSYRLVLYYLSKLDKKLAEDDEEWQE